MAEARAYREEDREALRALVRDAFGSEGGEDRLGAIIAERIPTEGEERLPVLLPVGAGLSQD